jgi:hypothetical protein
MKGEKTSLVVEAEHGDNIPNLSSGFSHLYKGFPVFLA